MTGGQPSTREWVGTPPPIRQGEIRMTLTCDPAEMNGWDATRVAVWLLMQTSIPQERIERAAEVLCPSGRV